MEETLKIDAELAKNLWKVPVEIDLIRDATLSANALRLYLDLLSYARDKQKCFPSGILSWVTIFRHFRC